ncbi:MAG: septation protein SpoVG family protein [Candidatus Omnitrophica bacterium]|nr:septation protein SpoVG family protein [Candidatus Omnitrophota bacterium]
MNKMEITEVRIFLKDGNDKKLKAYATVTFDNAFVVRNIKIIEGQKGLFVAMPSRKLKDSCPKCNFKNVVRSKFCNNCGASLPLTDRRPPQAADETQRESEHRDIAHPITLECREYLQKRVLEAYDTERKKGPAAVEETPVSKQPFLHKEEKREEKKSLEGDLEF